jgi:anti-sigma factor RsiW
VTCPQTLDLGVYVLGALPPDERRRFEEHLAGCPECAAELAELEPLPALLGRVRPEDLEPVRVTPSPGLFGRVAAAARARRAQRRRRLVLAAAAVVVVGTGAGAGMAVWSQDDDGGTWTASSNGLQLTVSASEARDGSALDVTVAGLPAGQDCELVVVDREGDRHAAGVWSATYSGEASWRGWTTVAPSSLSEIVLLAEDGRELARIQP